ncbi:MAG: nucleotidyl transferase AbiEii/AbiGii toxin family protein [Paracoccaceae bacterium]|nr:nucleotidyl transferase AbiEii/AbiGii toxin family protein [Paracoccaceae bacterium]
MTVCILNPRLRTGDDPQGWALLEELLRWTAYTRAFGAAHVPYRPTDPGLVHRTALPPAGDALALVCSRELDPGGACMIDRREILDTVGTLGLLPQVVEKDYVLGWVLAGIYRQTALAESWIFKGGTCLKKCYFETYRFSEDLDFTLTDRSQIDRDFLAGIFRDVGEWIYEQTGIELPEELQEFDVFENPAARCPVRAS